MGGGCSRGKDVGTGRLKLKLLPVDVDVGFERFVCAELPRLLSETLSKVMAKLHREFKLNSSSPSFALFPFAAREEKSVTEFLLNVP
jgi:hypothetical protein